MKNNITCVLKFKGTYTFFCHLNLLQQNQVDNSKKVNFHLGYILLKFNSYGKNNIVYYLLFAL